MRITHKNEKGYTVEVYEVNDDFEEKFLFIARQAINVGDTLEVSSNPSTVKVTKRNKSGEILDVVEMNERFAEEYVRYATKFAAQNGETFTITPSSAFIPALEG